MGKKKNFLSQKQLHTFSIFTFGGAPLEGFLSSFNFLYAFEGFEIDGVPRAGAEGAAFTGLLSASSSLGASFCFGASTGESSSIKTKQNDISAGEQHLGLF